MYAVVNTGGKQYKVQQGEILKVEKIPGDVGSPVTFDRVLVFSDGENISIGQPVLDHVSVEGHIVEQGKAKKIIVFKYKRRKRYRRKQGHRQEFTAVQIDSIKGAGVKAKEAPAPEKEPEPEVKKAGADTKAGKDDAKKAAPQEGAKQTKTDKAVAAKAEAEESETKEPETKKADSEKDA
ncbi:MAG: 50S ribosomal protein L21 [Desulfobacterales bacterium]|nr:MAG: 50S ribosomal protein L21 [Desulfobacterales bacterium]